jgi:hypothetical protein
MGTKGQGLDKGRKVLTRCGTLRQLARVVLARTCATNFWKLVAKSKHQVRLTT